MSTLRSLFRFSLAEALVGMLLMAGMFFINKHSEDSVIHFDHSDEWYWFRVEGFPFKMRTLSSGEMTGVSINEQKLSRADLELSNFKDQFYVKRSSLGKLTPPDSFGQEVLHYSGIVYNVLIDLGVLFVLHAGYVFGWRERRKLKLEAGPHVA